MRLTLFYVWVPIMISICRGHWLGALVLYVILWGELHAANGYTCGVDHSILTLKSHFLLFLTWLWLSYRMSLLAVLETDDMLLTILTLLTLLLFILRVEEVEDHWLDCGLLLGLS